jgi:hypothetical protein
MSECKWYQFGCKRDQRVKITTDIIPERIEDITSTQLKTVAGIGLVSLILVGIFTR